MIRRNSAFRVAIGGLSIAVVLCLVAAVSLLNSGLFVPAEVVPEVAALDETPAAESANKPPIRVASAGDVGHLLKDVKPTRPVPEPPEISTSETNPLAVEGDIEDESGPEPAGPDVEAGVAADAIDIEISEQEDVEPVDSNTPRDVPSAPLPPISSEGTRNDLEELRGQVEELARNHLESQIAEIRHSEQLLSAHQSQRLIESLQREIDELKLERVAPPAHASEAGPVEESSTESATVQEYDHNADLDVSDKAEPAEEELPPHVSAKEEYVVPDPAETKLLVEQSESSNSMGNHVTPVETELHVGGGATARVRYVESADQVGRYDVDADDASLSEFLMKLGPAAGWNLVASPELEGRVTCRWTAVDLRLALTQQLKVHGWTVREDGQFAIVEPIARDEKSIKDEAVEESLDIESEAPITLELETAAHDETAATYDQATGILIQPKLPPHMRASDRRRIIARSDAFRSRSVPSVPVRSIANTPVPQQLPESNPASGAPASESRTDQALIARPLSLEQGQSLPSNEAVQERPRFRVEATILEVKPSPGTEIGIVSRGVSVLGQPACQKCGQSHSTGSIALGHSANGWHELHDGMQCAVSTLAPDSVLSKLQEHAVTTVTSTPHVEVLDRQFAEIGLTEQPGFRRQIVSGADQTQELALLQGGVRLSLRPLVQENGDLQLDVSSVSAQSLATEATTTPIDPIVSLPVSPDRCVVVGGLYFEAVSSAQPTTRAKRLSSLLGGRTHAKNTHEVVIVIRVVPVIEESSYSAGEPSIPQLPVPMAPPRIVPPSLAPALIPPPAECSAARSVQGENSAGRDQDRVNVSQ